MRNLLQPRHTGSWPEVRDQLYRLLRGWSAYFNYGNRLLAYRAVDNYVLERVRHFLSRRHKVPSRGAGRYPDTEVFGALRVLRLRRLHYSSLP